MPKSKFFKNGFRPSKPPAAVSIRRNCYAMSMTDGLDAEIQFYGEIVRNRPVDWWTGEPEPGDFIMLDEFLEDLKSIAGAKTVLMRIDSIGGDSEVSIVIHNRLRELPAKKTARIDGVAMSGGTHITLAADVIQVNPSSQFMIHKCWCNIWGGFNADELRAFADGLDPTDKSQVAIYKARTGKSEEELLAMMSKTTTFVGQEIIDAGFADEMLDAAGEKFDIAASADGRMLFVNGHQLRMSPFVKLPEGIKVVEAAEADQTNTNQPETETGSTEGGTPMAKTLEELRKENPELATQIEAEARAAVSADAGTLDQARAAERTRLSEIDEIAGLYDDETVREAKYGEHPCTAQEMSFRAAQKAAKNGTAFMAAANADYKASGAAGVGAAPAGEEKTGDKTPNQRMVEARTGVKALFGEKEAQ